MRERVGSEKVLIVADLEEELAGAREPGTTTVMLDMEDSPVVEKLTQSLLEWGRTAGARRAGCRHVQRVLNLAKSTR